MGNIRLFLIAAVLCAVFGDVLSQSRGSSKYVPSGGDDSDEESTRSQRPSPPPRSTAVRRRRPTSTTETPPAAETQPRPQEGTTGRRVPSRGRFGSQTSVSRPTEEPPAPVVPEVTYDSPAVPSSPPEDKSQGRRRKPKKRRRPQGAKDDEKKDIDSSNTRKEGIVPLIAEPEPILPYSSDSETRSNPNSYDSTGLTDTVKWSHENYGADIKDPGSRNTGTQYYPPQSGTNRLPVEKTEESDNSRKYPESPLPARNFGGTSNRRYVPPEPSSNRGSYVPVLSPNRAPTEEQHSRNRDEVRTSNPHQQRRTSGSRSPIPNTEDVSDAKSHQTYNQRNTQPSIPSRSHSEVRLPQAEQPLVPTEYDIRNNDQPEYATPERLRTELGGNENLPEGNVHTRPQGTNRLPNPPEDPYKYTFPYSEENQDNEQVSHSSLPHSRQESGTHFSNGAIIPYSNVIPKDTDEPSRNADDADTNKQQISRYEPPLQRSGVSSQPRRPVEDKAVEAATRSRDTTRSRTQSRTETLSRTRGPISNKQETTTETPTRQRGASRYQPELLVNPPIGEPGSTSYTLNSLTRTRGVTRNELELAVEPPIGEPGSKSYTLESLTRLSSATRNQPDTSIDQPTRTRGSTRHQSDNSNNQPARGHGPTRNHPDTSVDQTTRTRGSTRNQADTSVNPPTRTRGSTRNQIDTPLDQPTRNRDSNGYTTDASLDAISRTRGSSRYQPDTSPDTTTRTRSSTRRQPDSSGDTSPVTRGSHRYQPDSSIDRPTRTRSSQAEVPTPSRSPNTLNHPADTEDSLRSSSRRYPPTPEVHSDEIHPQTYPRREPERPHEEADPALFSAYAHPTSRPDERDATDPNKNTLRSQPQYEVRQPEQPSYLYEEPLDGEQDPNTYVSEYQPPPPPPPQDVRNQRISPSTREQSRPQSNTDQRSASRQQQSDYRPPTRRQPQAQYQEPQNDRSQTRQQSRQQTRPRQEPAPATNPGRSSGASKFACPEAYGFFADPKQCDKYYECRNGTATDSLCEDGLVFNKDSAPKFLRCDSMRDVDCTLRPELQEPRPTKNCPRRYGLFPHQEDCTKFFNCVDGIATEVQCPPGLTFNDDRATCDWADLVKSSCKTEDLLGFTCPDPSAYDLQDGVYTSYPHPDNCQLHFVCIKGEDGERRPRMLACNEGLVYNPQSSACTRPDEVPGCEDFYGIRSPAPKRKPSREPLPTEPEPDEPEPKPIIRRVVQQNRRTRN